MWVLKLIKLPNTICEQNLLKVHGGSSDKKIMISQHTFVQTLMFKLLAQSFYVPIKE